MNKPDARPMIWIRKMRTEQYKQVNTKNMICPPADPSIMLALKQRRV